MLWKKKEKIDKKNTDTKKEPAEQSNVAFVKKVNKQISDSRTQSIMIDDQNPLSDVETD